VMGSNGVGSSDIVVDEDTCGVIGIVIGCGSFTVIIVDIGRSVVVIVAVVGVVGAGMCCLCVRFVGWFGSHDNVIDDDICISHCPMLA